MFTILHVEDDENDALFVSLAFSRSKLPVAVVRAVDGKEAVDYLSGDAAFADRKKHPWPSLVLLDLKLPILDGFQVLEHMRRIPRCASIPVFVLTSSDQEADKARATQMGVAAYLVKDHRLDHVVSEVNQLIHGHSKPATLP